MNRDKEYPDEWTEQTKDNALNLLKKVNALLNDLGVQKVKVSSGFRPSEINSGLPNSAKRSLHMFGMAVDIHDDKEQSLGKLIANRPDLLKKYNLWIEDLGSTQGKNSNWTHLDCGNRTDRPSRCFKP
jgi:hypothetical protein